MKELIDFDPVVYDHLLKQVRLYESNTLNNLLHLGEKYAALLAMKPWRYDKTGAKNAEHWIEQELRRSKSMVYNIIGLWRHCKHYLDAEPQLKETPPSHIYPLLPAIEDARGRNDDPQVVNLLHIAHTNNVEGIKNHLRELKGQVPSDSPECEHLEFRIIKVCKNCGKKIIEP